MNDVEVHYFGNPSSIHRYGQKARSIIETARKQVAIAIGCTPYEIVFTGGGSEANNLVLWNTIYLKKKHVITSAIEHPAVLTVLKRLKELGLKCTVVSVDKHGLINPQKIEEAIRDDTGLITIMYANNEVGTIQPIEDISKIANEYNILFHSDAVQVLGKIPVNVKETGADMMSFSAHKFYGPKGVGALYLKKGSELKPLIIGGGQERKLRAGTENVPGIAGLGLAAELAGKHVQETQAHLEQLARYFKDKLYKIFPDVIFNGHPEHLLPGLVNVTIPAVTSDIMLIRLDLEGIAVSSGSACSSGTVEPSHVLNAMNVSNDYNTRTLRISFGRDNTLDDVNILLSKMDKIINMNRNRT